MPMHNPYDPDKTYGNVPQEDRTLGYETTDVSVQGVLVFLVALCCSSACSSSSASAWAR